MNTLEIKQHLKELAEEYIYLGTVMRAGLKPLLSNRDRELETLRLDLVKNNCGLLPDERATSLANGNLCLYILGLMNNEERENG